MIAFLGALGALFYALTRIQLRTNSGRDWMARIMGKPDNTGFTGAVGTTDFAPASYIGLTANATAPAAGDTTLTGEITTGTLDRALATYAHTDGTATYTLTKTFTSDQTVVIAKIGVFTLDAGGVMAFETLLNATASLVSGDQLQVTETVTL